MGTHELEKSIEKIEIKISYTEEIVAQLNEIVTNQQKEIGILNNHINKLEKKIVELLEEGESSDLPNRKPPHY
ncbi:MAG: SlyX family protein [Pleomorphochaeta sp.]|jgi:SlyX protein